jgi:hypothetical protein
MSAYDRLADLAEAELAAITAGRTDDVPVLQAERDALAAALPLTPPAAARGALLRAGVAQAQIVAALTAARDAAGRELAHLRRGRGAVRAYGQFGAVPRPTADRQA